MIIPAGVLWGLVCGFFVAVAHANNPAADLEVAEGLEVRLWADSPLLFNPTNIDVDHRGRVWVAEGVNYRETIKPQNALKHPQGDRIVILEDTTGDGVADSSKVFVQDPDLIAPLGIAVLGNKIVVSCSPHLIVYTDDDGDDVPDSKQILLTGFGGFDHDHGLHSLVGALDGRWYFNVGNDGPHEVTDASGWTLRSGSCYQYRGKFNSGNRVSDDGRVWTGGLALRVNPDGTGLTVLAHNFRNSYEVAIDSFGELWQNDNDDEVQACRTSWVMEGGNYGFFSADGTRTWKAERRPHQSIVTAHWRQDDPGVMPAGDITGAGGPTGVVVYEGDLLPQHFHGAILNADAGRNLVYAHLPRPDGAGYQFERHILIRSKHAPENYVWNREPAHGANWFRPSDVAVGTDGAIYVADWYDSIVGGHDMKEKQGRGRIFRIAPKDRWNERPPKIDFETIEGLIAALNSPAINVRHVAAMKLRERSSDALPHLLELARGADPRQRARALWVLARCGPRGLRAVEESLRDDDPRVRVTAFRALRAVDHRVLEHAKAMVKDDSPAVRREVAIALRDVPLERCRDLLVALADGYDGADRFYLEAFGVACDGKEQPIYPVLLERFGHPDPVQWDDRMANLAWRLHPPASIDALATRVAAESLSLDARRRSLEAIAFIRDARAADAMAHLAINGPDDLRPLAQWWAASRAGNDWSEYASVKPFVEIEQTSQQLARNLADRDLILDANAPHRQRQRAAAKLAADPDGAKILFALAAEKTFPEDLLDAVLDPIRRNPDLAVRALASQWFPRRSASGDALPPLHELSALRGDATRGREVFFSETAGCAKCHSFAGDGRDIGPDLTQIRTKLARPELIDAILNPSASIAFGYETWIVRTRSGQVYAGFILADGPSIVLRETSGEQHTIPASEITLRRKQSISVMPDNIALELSAQDLADLAEFLLAPAADAP